MKRILSLLFAGLFLSACAKNAILQTISPEQSLRRRASAYWLAQKEKDWLKVRSFVDPEVGGELESYFKRRQQSKDLSTIVSVEITELSVEGDTGRTVTNVSLLLTHPLLGGTPYSLTQTVEDHWVSRQGVWYVIIHPPKMDDLLKSMQGSREKSSEKGEGKKEVQRQDERF